MRHLGLTGSVITSAPKFVRSFHAVDIENLLAGTAFNELDVRRLHRHYAKLAGHNAGDCTVIATSHFAADGAWFGWPGRPKRAVRSGPDGADHELLRSLDETPIAGRYGRVVIGSGDGIFADSIAELIAEGVHVTVVARDEVSLSNAVKELASDVRYLMPVLAVPRSA